MVSSSSFSSPGPYLTCGGIETTLEHKTPFPLRHEAAFEALLTPDNYALLRELLLPFARTAAAANLPLVLDTETWRASSHWYDVLKTPEQDRARVHKLALELAGELADDLDRESGGKVKTVVQGIIGPRSDGYTNDEGMTVEEARKYHRQQVREFKEGGLKLVASMTLTTSAEAIGVAMEAQELGMECLVAFTLGNDGNLPSGEGLGEAVMRVDKAGCAPLFYMINCVHPRNLRPLLEAGLEKGEKWVERIGGIRANGSAKSHDELDGAGELHQEDPVEWAKEVVALREVAPGLKVMGGCCGTDGAHCAELAKILTEE